jgi:sedoheptulose-bisphosphatase
MEDKTAALAEVLTHLKTCFASIAEFLRDTGSVSEATGSSNTFGDAHLQADVFSDSAIFACLRGLVKWAVSEETTTPQALGGQHFWATFDPLDGSSIIDTNFSVGSTFAIWDTEELIGSSGRSIVLAGMVVYGSRTTMLVSSPHGVDEYTLLRSEWVLTKQGLSIKPETKLFAPANLRAAVDHPGYRELVQSWHDRGFTLRYTGGMVPDIAQIFIKGSGVFANPASERAPAKLRLIYECAPAAYLVEAADGLSWSQTTSVLDVVVTDFEQKVPMCLGSAAEVERFKLL